MNLSDAIASHINRYPDFTHKHTKELADTVYKSLLDSGIESVQADNTVITLVDVAARSHYVRRMIERHPEWLIEWADDSSDLHHAKPGEAFRRSLADLLGDEPDEATLMSKGRLFRNREMTRIIWRDVLKESTLEETLAEVSALADVCIQENYRHLYRLLQQRYGTPRSRGLESTAQELIVLGMGKLGAKELNVSSDIDLIFAYPETGETDHPDKPIDNYTFFTKLGQKLINVLDQQTVDGFTFRVDMRLRPYGQSGALALNFAGFEDYFQNQGREWERFAMIKARAITGTAAQKEALQHVINPFVYRRYADFSSFKALRDMKRLIMSEVHRKGGDQNIKLGEGGIREIEFIAQACQLIYGGRDAALQKTGLLSVFDVLKTHQYLPPEWVDQLVAANAYLRNLEHAIQGLNDEQTQLIPDSDEDKLRVAWSMQEDAWESVEQDMWSHRRNVSRIFKDFLNDPEQESTESQHQSSAWLHLWQAHASGDQWISALEKAGFDESDNTLALLEALISSRQFSAMSGEAKERLEQFMPLLLDVVADLPQPSRTFERVMHLVNAVLGRTIYLVLLYENVEALRQLCSLCSQSPWVAEHLAKSPVILDELLNVQSLYSPPEKTVLQDELRQQLLRIPEEDLEAQMDCLRTFRKSHTLRVAASELGGQLPLMKVSDYLTWLAEVLLEQCVNIAWQNMIEKYGLPSGVSSEDGHVGFAVIGYGKLGGIELGYSSDLDMVFLYDANDHGATAGPRSINNQLFYARLGQRVIHILSTQTTQGDLYESDMRLRPSGNSGMLVSSLAAFQKYQHEDAWTWEHQAIVRARFICGDSTLEANFNQVRSDVLTRDRDPSELRNEVVAMREKMKIAAVEKFKSEEKAKHHIKQGDGGLIDIEFITQFGVLKHAKKFPELFDWTDNVRLLETLHKHQCFEGVELLPLIDAYRTLRSALHKKSLADEEYSIDLSDFPDIVETVSTAWDQVFQS